MHRGHIVREISPGGGVAIHDAHCQYVLSRAWARFFDMNRKQLKRVAILASSRGMELTMGIVRHLSDTAHLIQIYSDREAYEARKGLPAS